VITAEENEFLTRVGPGTPGGELLRRYWHPVALAQDLSDEQPTKFVRLLGEDLVLFKDKSGRYGLIQDHCAHRGASLLYGRVEERGIACAYHGWLYDTSGSCLECPAEPAGSMFHLTVKARAYPVQHHVGMYWAYLGPQPTPEIPHYDLWSRRDGTRRIYKQPPLDCNFLQPMENSVDPAHLQILHQDSVGNHQRQHVPGRPIERRVAPSTTRGFTDDVESFDFIEVPYGIMNRRVFKDGRVDEHPLIFPNVLRVGSATQIRVPVDDTHTQVFIVHFDATPDGSIPPDSGDPPCTYIEPYKTPVDALHPVARFQMEETQAQDHMAWETQGPIVDRTIERLATTDRGVVMLRAMYLREIERMQRGEDPKGVQRDPNHEIIDTNYDETMRHMDAHPALGR